MKLANFLKNIYYLGLFKAKNCGIKILYSFRTIWNFWDKKHFYCSIVVFYWHHLWVKYLKNTSLKNYIFELF